MHQFVCQILWGLQEDGILVATSTLTKSFAVESGLPLSEIAEKIQEETDKIADAFHAELESESYSRFDKLGGIVGKTLQMLSTALVKI